MPSLKIFSLSGAEPSPALLISPGRRGRRGSTQEKKDTPKEKPANEEPAGRPQEKRPGELEDMKFGKDLPFGQSLINY